MLRLNLRSYLATGGLEVQELAFTSGSAQRSFDMFWILGGFLQFRADIGSFREQEC